MGSREQKWTDILQAAINVFSECGFDKAKMEYVAKAAGIGKGTIYEYFASKEALFREVILFSIQTYNDGLREAMSRGENIVQKLVNCSRYNLAFLDSHIDMMQLALNVNILSKEMRTQLIETRTVIQQQFTDLVQGAKKSGELRADLDAELAALCIMGTIDQFASQQVFSLERRPLNQINHQAIINLLLQGLRNSSNV